ncbi:hypothetical protein SKAU_G00122110 [Synaphobranchus kaupii]|uniref:Uncharacterized protein n=1 Tax=Synaphobranchus kaupii TaxID=118154 RepID=A0A9Q1J2M4_SYNKA|nr:hypothetical protein SKAU_G00122110 [Synaphobranchus kaupii]
MVLEDARMAPVGQTVASSDAHFSKIKVVPRGASSHFVGSAIAILSSYAAATLAMNCGKKIQDGKLKENPS